MWDLPKNSLIFIEQGIPRGGGSIAVVDESAGVRVTLATGETLSVFPENNTLVFVSAGRTRHVVAVPIGTAERISSRIGQNMASTDADLRRELASVLGQSIVDTFMTTQAESAP